MKLKTLIHGIEDRYKYPIRLVRVDDFYKRGFLKGADRNAINKYKQQLLRKRYEPIFISGRFLIDGTHRIIAAHQLGLEYIKAYVAPQENPLNRKLKIRSCLIAEKDHKRELRNYAHWGHKPNVICISKSIYSLPLNHLIALLLHEVAHSIIGGGTEEETNEIVRKYFKINLVYLSKTPFGNRLQFIRSNKIKGGFKALKNFIQKDSLKLI